MKKLKDKDSRYNQIMRSPLFAPLLALFIARIFFYLISIQSNHAVEGDTRIWLGALDVFLTEKSLSLIKLKSIGYVMIEYLNYNILKFGHYSLLLFQNIFELFLCILMMNYFRDSKKSLWAIVIIYGLDLATLCYANSIMSDSLSAFLIGLSVFLLFIRNKVFWGGFIFGLSCLIRAGNFPIYLIFLGINLFNKPTKKKTLLLLVGFCLTVLPAIIYSGIHENQWRLSTQGDYQWATLGAGIIMRNENISWRDGEIKFNEMNRASEPGNFRKTFFRLVIENPGATALATARGFFTQYIGGQNAELMHRFQGREIEKDPLTRPLHFSLIGVHAIWMFLVWSLFSWACYKLWEQKPYKILIAFTLMAHFYFYASVATLGAPRFRLPVMPVSALCIALYFLKKNPYRQT